MLLYNQDHAHLLSRAGFPVSGLRLCLDFPTVGAIAGIFPQNGSAAGAVGVLLLIPHEQRHGWQGVAAGRAGSGSVRYQSFTGGAQPCSGHNFQAKPIVRQMLIFRSLRHRNQLLRSTKRNRSWGRFWKIPEPGHRRFCRTVPPLQKGRTAHIPEPMDCMPRQPPIFHNVCTG